MRYSIIGYNVTAALDRAARHINCGGQMQGVLDNQAGWVLGALLSTFSP